MQRLDLQTPDFVAANAVREQQLLRMVESPLVSIVSAHS
jgi:hypothetical protein